MNRRTALATLAAAIFAPLSRPRVVFTTMASAPPPRSSTVVIIEGTDVHGRPIREEVLMPEEQGVEVLSEHCYRDYSFTVTNTCYVDPTVTIGYGRIT